MAEKLTDVIHTLEDKIQTKNYAEVKNIVADMNPADLAVVFDELFGENLRGELIILYRLLPKDLASDVFAYMDADMQEYLIGAFSDVELKEVLSQSFIDDTVDIVEEMPANVVSRILKNSSMGARKAINEILRYPSDSAGSIMTIEYVSLHKDMTVADAFEKIREVGINKETIYTSYVTENRRLIGVVTVKDLFMAEEDEKIEDIMDTNVISVDTMEDKEVVAKMFGKYDFLALPVVDRDGRLVGIVTFDDAMDVMQEESSEDISKMAAIAPSEDEYFKVGIFKHAANRIVWLIVLMISAMITGIIIDKYQNAFEAVPILVSFMPMLMGTGGNCGSQSSTLIIRGMAIDEIHFTDFFKVVFKEFRIAILVSAALAIANGFRIYLFYDHNIILALTIALSIIFTVIVSKLIGAALPMIASKCKLDPAIMAAPLITTVVDTCSIMIYFTIATRTFNL